MRPGLRRAQAASSPPPSSHDPDSRSDTGSEWQLPPSIVRPTTQRNPLPITTTVRQQRATESQTQAQGRTRSRKRARPNEDDDDKIEQDEDHANENTTIENDNTPDADIDDTVPTFSNYRALGQEWGMPRAEKELASLTFTKNNRISATGLYEAQALQSNYELDKTMLCLVLKCSRRVLDGALLEGPLSREPNMYTNYQTYSIAATKTPMPPKGVSPGFKECNAIVGSTWSSYNNEEHEIFTPRLFERLCVATSEAYALTKTPLGINPCLPVEEASTKTPASTIEPLSEEELNQYVPVFERLVNLTKVSHDLYQGRLWRHSGKYKNQSMEKLMNFEISKIIRQLHVLKEHFNLQFHLLVASWNPATSAPRALFQEEYTSCARWARDQQKVHLLECFAFKATKAPQHLRSKRLDPKPMSEGAARQGQRRTELAHALNDLIAPHLRGGYQGRGDAHPKVPNLKAAFAAKTFRGDIKLTFQCTPQSRITDLMISKVPGHLSNDEVEIWIDDIRLKNYTIIALRASSHITKSENDETSMSQEPSQTDLAEESVRISE
ncbi:uncharacterized protein MELLADRAFT_92269 [Melampsora larici-populina 98AG31]|uniref:Uncharacterized protein n=1 Tax=Melampsora larici-populina (strain 98AG31 / pathotype 3-4-7) TaxID=747676 RepID=F4R911_MELLP|nr:uncharacterized protein MELLADRAFT_92269 [Melampsora larici-populina 98AG31]EGG10905.1 hypothetical protein MELLADRAFT_92269 [Melampsora larici-populina 98AG31]